MEKQEIRNLFEPDVISRAKAYLDSLNVNGTGYYFFEHKKSFQNIVKLI